MESAFPEPWNMKHVCHQNMHLLFIFLQWYCKELISLRQSKRNTVVMVHCVSSRTINILYLQLDQSPNVYIKNMYIKNVVI